MPPKGAIVEPVFGQIKQAVIQTVLLRELKSQAEWA
jgi:hypothetical protein